MDVLTLVGTHVDQSIRKSVGDLFHLYLDSFGTMINLLNEVSQSALHDRYCIDDFI